MHIPDPRRLPTTQDLVPTPEVVHGEGEVTITFMIPCDRLSAVREALHGARGDQFFADVHGHLAATYIAALWNSIAVAEQEHAKLAHTKAEAAPTIIAVAPDEKRCRKVCPHGDRCYLEAGHEKTYYPSTEIPVGCSHLPKSLGGCECNEPNVEMPEKAKSEKRFVVCHNLRCVGTTNSPGQAEWVKDGVTYSFCSPVCWQEALKIPGALRQGSPEPKLRSPTGPFNSK